MMADDELEIDEKKFRDIEPSTILGCLERAKTFFPVQIDVRDPKLPAGNDTYSKSKSSDHAFCDNRTVVIKITSNDAASKSVKEAKEYISKVILGDEVETMTINCPLPPPAASTSDNNIAHVSPYHPTSLPSDVIGLDDGYVIDHRLSRLNLSGDNRTLNSHSFQTSSEKIFQPYESMPVCVNPPNYVEKTEILPNASGYSHSVECKAYPYKCAPVDSLSHKDQETRQYPYSSSPQSTSSESSVDRILFDPDYIYNAERFIKLGYPEDLVLSAFKKVGMGAAPNDVLSELIQLGGGMKSADEEYEIRSPDLDPQALEDSGLPLSEVQTGYEDSGDNNLRLIVIDGSNVAMSHGNKEIFSCRGIKIAVDWFKQRGHTEIKVFVPQWRKETSKPQSPISGQEILTELEKEKILIFTPARRVAGKRIACYDDRYVVKLAAAKNGIVVSNDNYRDLIAENPEYKKVVEERLLMYAFVDDQFMPPDDPLGKYGPCLNNFLQKEPKLPINLPPTCPYGKKCTYGNKCKYYHPERQNLPHKSVTDKLAEQSKQKIMELKERGVRPDEYDKGRKKPKPKLSLSRTQSVCSSLDSDEREYSGEMRVLTKEKLEQNRAYEERLNEKRKEMERFEEEQSRHTVEIDPICDAIRPELVNFQSEGPPRITVTTDNLNTPSKTGGKFVSGHLQLAERLSDDSNDTTLKGRGPSSATEGSTALDSDLFQLAAPMEQKLSSRTQFTHQKLSRQKGVIGSNDPRLTPGSRNLTNFSTQQINTTQSFPQTYNTFCRQDSHGVEKCSSYPMSPNDLPHIHYNRQVSLNAFSGTLPSDMITDHVSDIPSPMPHKSQTNNPFFNRGLVRQDSTSDPDIHRLYSSNPHQYNPMYSRSVSVSTHQPFTSQQYPSHVQAGSYVRMGPQLCRQQSETSHLQQVDFPFTPSRQVDPWQQVLPTQPHVMSPQQQFPSVTSYPAMAEIRPDDPRYTTYYHLSSLFGEVQVRTVMNTYPHILDAGKIVSLLQM